VGGHARQHGCVPGHLGFAHDGRPVTVGELFDPDDVVARWVFSLTAAVEDLSITQALFKNALDADAPLHKTGRSFVS
jgi:hypothetical protein